MRIRTMVGACVVALLCLLGGTGTAFADIGQGGDGDNTGSPASPPASSGGSTAETDAGGCHLLSTSSFLGATCPGGKALDAKSLKEILDGRQFVRCWFDKMTAAEHESSGLYDNDTQVFYIKRCFVGIDEDTLKVTPPVRISEKVVWFPPEVEVTTLPGYEDDLVGRFSDSIPFPYAVVSPTAQPRVGAWVSFADGQPTHDVTVTALGVTLHAVEDRILVKPLGAGDPAEKRCDGTGHLATEGETPVPDGNCWFKYLRSSAGQDGETFPVKITAHWTVTYTDALGTHPFNDFTKSQVTPIGVTEIQALNVQ